VATRFSSADPGISLSEPTGLRVGHTRSTCSPVGPITDRGRPCLPATGFGQDRGYRFVDTLDAATPSVMQGRSAAITFTWESRS